MRQSTKEDARQCNPILQKSKKDKRGEPRHIGERATNLICAHLHQQSTLSQLFHADGTLRLSTEALAHV